MAFIHNETGFSTRVDRAIECLRLGAHDTTRYGACFADGDGAAVAAAVLFRAAGDPDLAEAIDGASRRDALE
ncbi:MAG: hypothetical protein HQL38_10800, partial [Alphaproteobacteria bacterium]|nr:hypothetical protein [Alphaproteobacteria bacterium]